MVEMATLKPPSVTTLSLLVPFVPRILTQWAPGPGEQTTIEGTLVFADISGFTALSERLSELGKAGAEELTAILTDVFTDLLGHAESLGGDLLSFGGDALLLMFSGDGHAGRAVRAAAMMRKRLKERGPVTTGRGKVRLRISMGVHTGEILLVAAGVTQRELLVVGPAATAVTDMESAAEAGEILCSPSTAAALPRACRGACKGDGILLARMPVVGYEPEPGGPTASELDSYVPAAVRRLVEAGIDEPEHRYVAVGFVHVGGTDQLLADRGIAEVVASLNHLVDVATTAADEAGVTLVATDVAGNGAKLILTSGAPSAREDGEARLLVAVRALATTATPLQVRIGVHAGHVYAGPVGAPWRRVYTVMGDAVNLAARLMSKADPGQVVASKSLVHASTSSFEVTALEPFMVKGKSRPQEAYLVGPQIEGGAKDIGHDDAPFVGRDLELERLTALLEGAVRSEGGCVSITGEAGIGKTRLLEEALSRIQGIRTVRVSCDLFQQDRAHFASRLAIRAVLGIPTSATSEEAGQRLTAIVTATDPSLLQWLPLIASTVAASVEPTATVDDMDVALRPQVVREVVDQLLRQVVTEPTAFVFDDSGRMDGASAELFARLALGVPRRPWALCTTNRGEPTGLHPGLGYEAEAIELMPLSAADQDQLAAAAGEDAALSDHALHELTTRAAGNPLYLLELIAARISSGAEGEVPASLEGLVAARIDGLDPGDRRILRYASVLGARFPEDLFRRAVGDLVRLDDDGVWRRLAPFVNAERGDIRFRQDLVREVAYDGLPFRVRRDLHRRVAAAVAASSVHISDSLMAIHYDRAGDHEPAWRHARGAGERAVATFANAEAAAQYERALSNGVLAEVADLELAEVAEAMGDASQLAGQFDRAIRGYRFARSRRDDGDPTIVRLLRKEGVVRDRTGHYEAAVRWFRAARKSASRFDTPEVVIEVADILVYLAGTKYRLGQLDACIRWCEEALEAAARTDNRRAEAHACYLLDNVYTDLGRPEAHEYRHRALPIFEELNDYVGQGHVLNNLGASAVVEGRWTEAVEFYERSRQAQLRAGDVVGIANALHNLGELRSAQGSLEEAEALLREARRIWRAAGYTLGVAAASSGLGRTVGRRGRVDEGIGLLIESEESFKALSIDAWAREAAARRAGVLVFAGRFDEARALADEVVDSALDDEPALAILLRVRGLCIAVEGAVDEAASLVRRSIAAARQAASDYETVIGLAEMARLPNVSSDEREAAKAEASEIAARLDVDLDRVLHAVPWSDAGWPAGAAGPSV